MTSSYLARLLCISLASFFLLHAALGTLAGLLAPTLIRKAGRFRPRAAARVVLVARLMPAAAAMLFVTGLCVPSFLWLEQESGAERIGVFCLSAAALGLTIGTLAILRSVRAVIRSKRYVQQIVRATPGVPQPWIVDARHAIISLAGIVHPRLLVSRAVAETLSREQLAAALRHERAHRESRDNLKRLLILAAPGILPLFHGFKDLERAWNRFSEWAADDRAVAGSSHRSLSLAAALVKVARLGAGPEAPLVTSLVGGGEDLSARIERLLKGTIIVERPHRIPAVRFATAALLSGAAIMMMLRPATMMAVHRLLENLIQ